MSLIRRIFGFVFLTLIPFLMIVGIIWSGYQVAEAMLRQLDEQQDIETRLDSFPGTATFIALNAASPTSEPTSTDVPTSTESPTSTATETLVPTTVVPTPTLTETLPPSATNTAMPTDTPSPMPSATAAPTDLPTEIPSAVPTETEEAPLEVLQFNATNTPRSVLFATNTPVGEGNGDGPATEEPTVEAEPTFTSTPEATEVVFPTNTPLPAEPAQLTPTATNLPLPTETPVPAVEVVATRPLPTAFFPREAEAGQALSGTAVPTVVPLVPREGRDLLNIVLLGGDDELTEDGTIRTDTMIVVSINRDTNTVSMLSLPRDMFVYIPTESGAMARLNVVYGFGESIGWTGGGFGLLRQTIQYNFGINVHFYALVNFSGFEQLIDTLGGVDIAVDCAYQDYQLIGAEVPDGAVEVGDEGLRTLDVGYYEMNGAQALWYARTRRNSSDFDRGRRQQQLLRAIWRKGRDSLNIANAPQLWGQLNSIVETDMGIEDFIGLVPIALNLDVSRIRSYTLIRTYHTIPWQPPDGAFVQLPVYDTMRPLLEDFYRPPVDSQLLVEGATIEVYNGTTNEAWDRVAAERLGYEGFRATWQGAWETTDATDTILIDYTGQQKGSSRIEIANILNIRPENIREEPDANRTADFRVILGSNYDSCNIGGVLPVDQLDEEAQTDG